MKSNLIKKFENYVSDDTMDIDKLKEIHEKIRGVLIEHGCEEYGDAIIDDICIVVGIPTTIEYYDEE